MLFKGTAITRGSGEGVVVSTGMQTELGRISGLVATATEEITPFERRLARLAQRLVWVTLGIAAMVAGFGILAGKHLFLIHRDRHRAGGRGHPRGAADYRHHHAGPGYAAHG